jgi:DNA-binding transcriptional regulator YbjK
MTQAIKYQGRKARRAGSEQRRQNILEAALRIIVRDGIRNVRHRAVANEAEVPLSATTYYFKDIQDLIADTFTLFAERAMEEVIDPFSEQAFNALEQFDAQALKDPASRDQLIQMLTEMTVGFVTSEVMEQREHLIAEQAFLHEAVLDERLRELAQVYQDKQVRVLQQACEKLHTPSPEHDAQLVIATFYFIESKLLAQPESLDQDELRGKVKHLLDLLVGRDGETGAGDE